MRSTRPARRLRKLRKRARRAFVTHPFMWLAARTGPARFHEALEQGDGDRARRELDAWADRERAGVRAQGDLKIGVLSLLTEQQRKALASAYSRLIRQTWMPRPSWEPRPPQNLQPGKKRPGGTKRPAG